MLFGIDPLLSPDLLMVLRAMGHGDEIAIVDANHPAAANAKRLVRIDGANASQVLAAVLSLTPLDSFVECPAHGMQVVGKPDEVPPAVADFQSILDRSAGFAVRVERIERFAFYERVRACFAVVATGDRRPYANIILTKGVVGPNGKVVA